MLNAYPIFKKDFRQLMIFLAGALGIEAMIWAYWFRTEWYHTDAGLLRLPYEGFPQFQAFFMALIALGCAGHWWAEERSEGNDKFLQRLPLSHSHIYYEKAAAGVLTLLAVYSIQFVLLICLRKWLGEKELFVELTLADILGIWMLLVTSAYIIGLLLSRWMTHILHVVFLGCVIEFFAYWIFALSWRGALNRHLDVPGSAILLAESVGITALCVAGWFITQRIRGKAAWLPLDRYKRQCLAVFACAILTGLAGILNTRWNVGNSFYMFCMVFGLSCLLSLYQGVSSYSKIEKEGTCFLAYNHPLSRSSLYWSRFCWGFPVALVLLFNMIIAMKINSRFYVRFTMPVWAIIIPLTYFAGLLITHAYRRPFYAAIATIIATAVAFLLLFIPHQFALMTTDNMIAWAGLHLQPQYTRLCVEDIWFTVVIACIGFAFAAWRCATDRAVLAGSELTRFLYVLRLFLFVMAVSLFVSITGFRDLFYLITKIDIGRG